MINFGNLKFRTCRPDLYGKSLIISKIKYIFQEMLFFGMRRNLSHSLSFEKFQFLTSWYFNYFGTLYCPSPKQG